MNSQYKNLVFTKHALARLSDRVLTQDVVYQTVNWPDKSYPKEKNTKFIRTINNRLIHAVAAPIENNQWLIISVWVRGEEDREPLMWQILSFPFKLIWQLMKAFAAKIAGKYKPIKKKSDLDLKKL